MKAPADFTLRAFFVCDCLRSTLHDERKKRKPGGGFFVSVIRNQVG